MRKCSSLSQDPFTYVYGFKIGWGLSILSEICQKDFMINNLRYWYIVLFWLKPRQLVSMSYHRKHLQYTSICERSEVLSDTLMVIVTMVITSVIISTFHICNSVKHSVYGNNDQFQWCTRTYRKKSVNYVSMKKSYVHIPY